MSANLGKMSAVCSLNADEYLGQLKKMQAETASPLASIKSSFGSIRSVLSAGMGIATGGWIKNILGDSAQQITQQSKLSDQLGVTTEASAALMSAARRSGIDVDSLGDSLQHVNREFGDMRQRMATGEGLGSGAGMAFARLGINAERFLALPLNQQLGELGDALKTIPNAADRASLSFALLGRHGQTALPVMMRGTAGLDQLQRQLENSGVAVGGDDASEFRQAMKARQEAI